MSVCFVFQIIDDGDFLLRQSHSICSIIFTQKGIGSKHRPQHTGFFSTSSVHHQLFQAPSQLGVLPLEFLLSLNLSIDIFREGLQGRGATFKIFLDFRSTSFNTKSNRLKEDRFLKK